MSGSVWEVNNTSYVLNDEQTKEVEAYSDSEKDDAAFNKWFVEYCQRNGVKAKGYSRAKYWSHVPNAKNDIDTLVAVKQSALTLIKVIDPTITAKQVDFDSPDDDGGETKIVIPSAPALEKASIHEAIDATAGYAIHSAFFNSFGGVSRNDRSRVVMSHKPSEKETVRKIIDGLTTINANAKGLSENPGFTGYINDLLDARVSDYVLPVEFPENDAGEQLAALMSPYLYGTRVGDPNSTKYADKIDKANKIIDDFVNREHFSAPVVEKSVKSIMDLLDVPDPDGSCETPVPMGLNDTEGDGIKPEIKETVDARIEQEQEIVDKKEFAIGQDTGNDYEGTFLKLRPPDKKSAAKINATAAALKADAKLRLRKTLDRKTERFQRSGDLDEDELYRLVSGDPRVFLNVEEEQEESASIHFLVDMSGSMQGTLAALGGSYRSKLSIAIEMAWVFAHSMNKRREVNAYVWGHTGDSAVYDGRLHAMFDQHSGPIVYNFFRPGDSLDRLGLMHEVDTGNNYDGYAIEYVGKVLSNEEAEKKYLIVLSDGYPAGYGYGGLPARLHVRQATDALIRKGIHVVQLAIGGDVAAHQAEMFKHFVMYKSVDQLITDFAKILDKAR